MVRWGVGTAKKEIRVPAVGEIKNWIHLVKDIYTERNKYEYSELFTENIPRSLQVFQQAIENEPVKNKKSYITHFLMLFEAVYKDAYVVSTTSDKSENIFASLASLSKILYMYDTGYELLCYFTLANPDYSSTESQKKLLRLFQYYSFAAQEIMKKRIALCAYMYPFKDRSTED